MNYEALKKRLDEKKLSKAYLAYNLNMTVTSFYNKLSGRTEFTVEEFRKLCDLIEIEPNDLLTKGD